MKLLEFSRQFSTEEDCERYLKEQRKTKVLVLASISYRPEFEHRIYNHSDNRG